MSDIQLETPVALLIFNRPDTTAEVFAEIAKARPRKLLVIADGPRLDRAQENGRCAQAREIATNVTWPCEVLTNFSEKNLGCKERVSSGINWVFEQVEEAIILEDDCVPDPTFFRFCEEMLVRYRDDERIGMISGDNFQGGRVYGQASYYFSRYAHIWGWATWRRVWSGYDKEMSAWPAFKAAGRLKQIVRSRAEQRFWSQTFDAVHSGKIDTWDYQLVLTLWQRSQLSVAPQVNLIRNVGFGVDATHTTSSSDELANLPAGSLQFPLRHPTSIETNDIADDRTAREIFVPTLIRRLVARLRAIGLW